MITILSRMTKNAQLMQIWLFFVDKIQMIKYKTHYCLFYCCLSNRNKWHWMKWKICFDYWLNSDRKFFNLVLLQISNWSDIKIHIIRLLMYFINKFQYNVWHTEKVRLNSVISEYIRIAPHAFRCTSDNKNRC